MKTVRILIADDHELMRRGLRSMLSTRAEFEISGEAVDGRDAVDQAKEIKPDIIILDISMPKLNGLEAARIIRGEIPGAQIVILSQYEESEMGSKAIAAGAQSYVSKASGARKLLAAIDAIVDHRTALEPGH